MSQDQNKGSDPRSQIMEDFRVRRDILFLGLLAEVIDCVIWQRRVRNTICATQQHLEGNVGNQLSHLSESVPWVFIEETHSNVESGTTPAFETVKVAVGMAGLLGNVQQIDCSDAGSQQRLMSITPSCVHEKASFVLADGLCESLWPLVDENVSPSFLAWHTSIDLLSSVVEEFRHDDLALELGLSNLPLNRTSIDGDVAKVRELTIQLVQKGSEADETYKFLGTVLTANKVEQLGGIINESGPAGSLNECRMGKKGSQEWNVGLDSTDTEFD